MSHSENVRVDVPQDEPFEYLDLTLRNPDEHFAALHRMLRMDMLSSEDAPGMGWHNISAEDLDLLRARNPAQAEARQDAWDTILEQARYQDRKGLTWRFWLNSEQGSLLLVPPWFREDAA